MKPTTLLAILAPLSLVALAASVQLVRAAEARQGGRVWWDEEAVEFLRTRVSAAYVDELTETQQRDAFNAALDGYLHALPDDYGDWIPPEEYRKWTEANAGQYAGVGVKIERLPGTGLRLVGVFPGGPAHQGGLRIGDLLTHVDGRALGTLDLTREENLRLLKGTPDSRVVVTVRTPPPEGSPAGTPDAVRDATLVRAVIRPPSVFPRRVGPDNRVGYIRVSEFTEATPADFDRALDAAVADGAKAVIVDLRGNGGGTLPATVRLADRFVAKGEIVRLQGRDPSARRVEMAREQGTVPAAVGLVVLVDGRSASASEVLAGCIQDHRRGVLLGTRTYGKFLVQNVMEVPGRAAALKITTARYQTPLGRSYSRKAHDADGPPAGLVPDVVVEMSDADRERLERAWANADDAVWGAEPRFPEVPEDWQDPQLSKALDLIAGDLLLQDVRSGSAGGGH